VTATGGSTTSDAAQSEFAYRELRAVREIAHAFLVADRPEEVHQFALDRVTPLLGASFSLVMLLDAAGEFMHPVAQHQWPARYADWIGALRVRVGQGPSGVAVAERRVVEVADLHGDVLLSDWFDVATELGFRSIVAAPLIGARGALGAIAFYFVNEREVSTEQRDMVRLIADQLAATSDKAQLIAELRRANAALADANATLELQASQQFETQRRQFAFFDHFTRAVMHVAFCDVDPAHRLHHLHELAHSAQQAVALEGRTLAVAMDDVDPRQPLLAAVTYWRPKARPTPITVGEPSVLLPTMRTDASLVTRALHLALGVAVEEAQRHGSPLHSDVELGRGFVAYRLQWTATHDNASMSVRTQPGPAGPNSTSFDPFEALEAAVAGYDSSERVGDPIAPALTSPLDLPLARSLARLLGGDVQRILEEGEELAIASLSLIFPLDAAPDTDAAMARVVASTVHRGAPTNASTFIVT
jgi:GAF domain-containing protein